MHYLLALWAVSFAALLYGCATAPIARSVGGTYVVEGSSMEPAFRAGDTVTTAEYIGKLAVGDVVLVDLGVGRPVIHRIVATSRHHITTRGDATGANDITVARGYIVARITGKVTR